MSDDQQNDEVEAERDEESADVEGHRKPYSPRNDEGDDEPDIEGHRK